MFYYSTGIFKEAGIPDDYVRYTTLGTGVINVAMTIVAVSYTLDMGERASSLLHIFEDSLEMRSFYVSGLSDGKSRQASIVAVWYDWNGNISCYYNNWTQRKGNKTERKLEFRDMKS